jgi:hypothetical protein
LCTRIGPRFGVPAILGAKTAKYAVVKYMPAVTPPSAACSSRPEADMVCLLAAELDVISVAANGASVINPSR